MYDVFGTVDGWLPVAPAVRLAIWGALTGAISMVIYRLISPQGKLSAVQHELQRTKRELDHYEGEFHGMLRLVRRNIGLAMKRVGWSLGPSILAGACVAPLLFCVQHQYSTARALQTNPSGPRLQQRSSSYSERNHRMAEQRTFSVGRHVSTKSTPSDAAHKPSHGTAVAASSPSAEYIDFGPPWMRSWWFPFVVGASISALGIRALIGIA